MSRVADTIQRGGPHSRSPVPVSAGQRASQLPSLGQSTPRDVTNPNERNAQGVTVASRRSSLWSTNELNKLADLVNRHRDASGRIQWRNLGPAWESLRNENDPQRTIAALKGAYAKLARGTGRAINGNAIRAPRAGIAEPSENAERQSEQEGRNGPTQEGMEDAREERTLGPSMPTAQEPRETSESGNENIKASMKARFHKYYRIAISTQDRQPIRRPKGEIPKVLLGIGNEVLAEELRERKIKRLTSLNAAVYAIARVISAKAIEDASKRLEPERERFNEAIQLRSTLIRFISALAGELRRRRIGRDLQGGQGRPNRLYLEVSKLYKVSRTVDVQRLQVRLRDQLNIVQQDIKRMEDAKRRFQVRRRGPSFVAREPRDQGGNVPVNQVREYWAPIVGKVQPFVETVELATWSRTHRRTANTHVDVDLSEDDWRTLFSRIKPWKATGPDGIQGFWWKHLPEAKERLKEWCMKALHRRREVIPRWLCRGKVVLIPKGKSAAPGPGDFRPIACLNTCYKRIMSKQSVRYHGYQNGKVVRSAPLDVRNGLMQGDTLSPLLFCLAIAPISGWLSSNIEPYKTKTGSSARGEGSFEVGHIFYMDDLKVYSTSWDDLVKAKAGIQRVAEQLGLKMNPQKCAVKSLNAAAEGRTEIGEIPILGLNSFYKYLGAEQDALVSMREVWQRVQVNAWNTAVRIMNSELTVRQKVQGYNQTVIPKLKYAVSCVIFGKGRLISLKKKARDFDIRVRKLLEESKMRFGYSCVARLYVSKEEGGLGLKSVEEEVEHTIVYTWCYLSSNPDFIVPYQLAESLRASSKRSLTSDFKSVLAANGLEGRVTRTILTFIEVDGRRYDSATKAARVISTLVHQRWAQFQMSEWRKRRLASRVLEDPDGRFQLNHKDSFQWLSKGWVSSAVLRKVWAAISKAHYSLEQVPQDVRFRLPSRAEWGVQ
ncbi:hypothetical protein OSTOST_15054 [Ostertagia ostertagi]